MSLNSWEFLVYFIIVLILFWGIPRKYRYVCLSILSGVFYAIYSVKYFIMLLVMTVIGYGSVKLLLRINGHYKRAVLAVCLLLCISPLIFFKYTNFVVGHILNFGNRAGGFDLSNIVAPLGISYYTFSLISYVVDVYKGDMPEANIMKVFLYLSYFPKVISGPIEKAKEFWDKIERLPEVNLNLDRIEIGMQKIVYGLFLKMVIADRANLLVNYVYDNYIYLGTIELVLGSILFSMQIYMDFAGYTNLAMGISMLLGIQLKENFKLPYLATSINEFWKAWHISLTDWLRQYIYIPLGGNRKGKVRTYVNLMLVFMISGIWHGAGLNFLLWGILHGFYQVVGKYTRRWRNKLYGLIGLKTDSGGYKISQGIVTFSLVNFAWIFFRANNWKVALLYIKRMFTIWNPWNLFNDQIYAIGLTFKEWHILFLSLLVVVIAEVYEKMSNRKMGEVLKVQSIYVRSVVYIFAVVLLFVYALYGTATKSTFIYFNF